MRNINTFITFAYMSRDETYTYTQAKHIFNNAELKADVIIEMQPDNAKVFRKHLSEMIKRQQSAKRFTSRLLNNNKIKIIRIE